MQAVALHLYIGIKLKYPCKSNATCITGIYNKTIKTGMTIHLIKAIIVVKEIENEDLTQ